MKVKMYSGFAGLHWTVNGRSWASESGRYFVAAGAPLEEEILVRALAEYHVTDREHFGGECARNLRKGLR